MDIKINMLNVRDGDAIIIELFKPKASLVIVIDGGEKGYYKSKVKPKLESILIEHSKKAPDVVVCSHYDSDHIGGLIPLLEDYIDNINQVWVHSSADALESLYAQIESLSSNELIHLKNSEVVNLEMKVLKESQATLNEVKEQKEFILESLNQLKQLINLIPPTKLKQVFHKQTPLTAWPEIIVLGPTKEYFNSLFPKNKELASLILEEIEVSKNSVINERTKRFLELAIEKPCDKLKDDSKAKITSTNKASIIIAIDNNNGRYLFTGDAGLESFKKIPDWENELSNLYFLKVPHHGSNNNMSKEMAEKMKPKYAYSTGDTFQDDEVIDCLATKTKDKEVKTTKSNGDLFFDK